MNIRSSAQTVMCKMHLEKQGKAVKLNVGERWNLGERWNPLIIQSFFFYKVAMGCVQVAMFEDICPHRHISQ